MKQLAPEESTDFETMGWVWRDDEPGNNGADRRRSSEAISVLGVPESKSVAADRCSTRRIMKSQCRTEEVEDGKFIRKCEKTEQVLKDCFGRPAEVVESNKEYIEEDVTDEVLNKKPSSFTLHHSDDNPFDFPGLRTDIKSIERSLFSNMKSVFDAVDEFTNGIFGALGTPNIGGWDASTPDIWRGIPVEDIPSKKPSQKSESPDFGSIDISGLARDV